MDRECGVPIASKYYLHEYYFRCQPEGPLFQLKGDDCVFLEEALGRQHGGAEVMALVASGEGTYKGKIVSRSDKMPWKGRMLN